MNECSTLFFIKHWLNIRCTLTHEPVTTLHDNIEPIHDDRLKKIILKPWKGVLSIHLCVCVSVCLGATGHIFWPMNLIFGLNDPRHIRKKPTCVLFWVFFEIFIATLFMGIFRFFPYIPLLVNVFKLPVTVFHLGM